MGLFNFLGNIFSPLSEIVDELHSSDEEMGNIDVKKREISAKIAEIEAKVTTKMVELQTKAMEANAAMEISAQTHGNFLSKSWRPVASLAMVTILVVMGFGIVPYKPLMVQIAGGFLGIYGIGRTVEKKKK